MRDVAKACGLAMSTVSNALANKSVVRPETRMLVRHTAEQLGYRASSVARGLRTGKTWSVAMVIADITNPFHGEVVRGVESVLVDAGYHLFLANTDGSPKKQTHYVEHFIDRQVDGMILQSHSADDSDLQLLRGAQVPTVYLLSRPAVPDELDFVGIENAQSMRAALNHLWAFGHRRIGFIGGPKRSSGATQRLAAYEAFMKDMAGAIDPALIDQGDYTIESGRVAAARLLGRAAPTALMVSEDMMALGAMTAASELGLNVPGDLSIVGWSDLFTSGLPQVNLTTLNVPKRELGHEAARLLMRRLSEPAAAFETRLVRPQLVVRGTTGVNARAAA